jgi:hypothetical protein
MKNGTKIISVMFAVFFTSLLSSACPIHAQMGPVASNNTGITVQKDIFKVLVTLFGVKNDTGNVVSFVKVNNVTAGKLFNATKDDLLKDKDGIVDTTLVFPNETVAVGAQFDACVLILKTMKTTCANGYNSPGPRTEIEQIVVP